MRKRRAITWVATVLLAVGLGRNAVGASQPPGPASASRARPEQTDPVQVRTWLSRTAVWVGDRITYTIELRCAADIGILHDDLDQAKLRLHGLEIVSADTGSTTQNDGASIQRFSYTLTTYEPASATLRIDEMPVRFYRKRPGQRIEDVMPAGELRIPPSSIPLRSTVPDGMKAATIRTIGAHGPMPMWWPWMRPIGIGLIVISIVPVVLWVGAALHRLRPLRPKRHAWQALRLTRKSLTELRSVDIGTEPARRDAYVRLDRLVRGHLGRNLSVPAAALSAAELNTIVKLPADILSLLEECEYASYCPPGRLPDSNRFLRAIEQAEALVAQR